MDYLLRLINANAEINTHPANPVPESQPPLPPLLLLTFCEPDSYILIVNVLAPLPYEFLAVTANVNSPDSDGVPEITPDDELRVKPAGSEPDDTDHVTPDTFALSPVLYEVPFVPSGRLEVVIVIFAGLIIMLKLFVIFECYFRISV